MNDINKNLGLDILGLDNRRTGILKNVTDPKSDREVFDLDAVSISLPDHYILEEGELFKLPLTHTPSIYNEPNIVWESSNLDVALVRNGMIKGVKTGNTTITATDVDNPAVNDTCAVEVYGAGQTPYYTLTVTSGDTSMGTVSGSGSYKKYAKATITATPLDGYTFVKWSDDDTNATRTIEVTEAKTLTATFIAQTVTYTVTLTAEEGGTVQVDTEIAGTTSAKTVEAGTQVTIKAIAGEGYTFTMWSDSETLAERTITVNENKNLTATFTATPV